MCDLIERHEFVQDCDCGSCSYIARNMLREKINADDERLLRAGMRVGIVAGCDTAEWMADEIERLREFVEEVRRTGDTRLASMAIAVLSTPNVK